MKKKQIKKCIKILEFAREYLQEKNGGFICWAIENYRDKDNKSHRVCQEILKNWIRDMLGRYTCLEHWLQLGEGDNKNVPPYSIEVEIKLLQTRLNWIDWMISELSGENPSFSFPSQGPYK